MAIILSRQIKKYTKKRLLVCGDSFFYDAKKRFPGLHWSQRLPDHMIVDNAAYGGASNTCIMDQFIERFDDHDVVIFGFTHAWRIEFARPLKSELENYNGKWLTNCYPSRMSHRQTQFYDDYCNLISPDAEIVRQCSIMIGAVEMARSLARVYYSLGGGDCPAQDLGNDYPTSTYVKKFRDQQIPFNLTRFFESDDYREYRHLDGTDSHPPFHVHLPEIQQRFADQVRDLVDND
jgi:hypothetical protein